MRQVAREPQQLELERERKRVEGGARMAFGRRLVEKLQEACQRAKRACIRLLLGEEAQRRFESDQAYVEAIRILTRRMVRFDQLDAGHSLQLARPLMQEQLDMAQRLQPRAEARLRSPDTFCHSADATPLERVEVKDAVCLAESERSQDDGLGLVGPPGHRVPKCRDRVGRGIAGPADFVYNE